MAFRTFTPMVRRNVNLNRFLADTLEHTADVTDHSQGDLIDMALRQPIMQRLFAFTAEGVHPIVALLEDYQADERMDPTIGTNLLQPIRTWLKTKAVPKAVRPEIITQLNQYVASHITQDGIAGSSFLADLHELACDEEFVISGEPMRERLISYIDRVLAGREDRLFMGESFHFRNIEQILLECFEAPSEEELTWFYEEFSDGWVLPK